MEALGKLLSTWQVTRESKRVDAWAWFKLAGETGLDTAAAADRLYAVMSDGDRQLAVPRLAAERKTLRHYTSKTGG